MSAPNDGGKRAQHTPVEFADGALEPFCACGRRWGECDGSRVGCKKRRGCGNAGCRSVSRRVDHDFCPTCRAALAKAESSR